MDINSEVIKFHSPPGVNIHIGSQADDDFLRHFVRQLGTKRIDIVVDDAAHQSEMMINAFRHIYPMLSPRGVYVVEDIGTNYNPSSRFFQNEGLRRPGTFMEHSKLLIDELNGYLYTRDNSSAATAFTSSTNSMHFYEGM
eukprot:6517869-Prymnesium_polylepis.1